ncbi:MAG: hypothetical protein R3Y56_05565 [Akkermansia sp.]
MNFIIASLSLFGVVYIPAQFFSYWKRRKRSQRCLQCRLCGYRFIKADPDAICPHCSAKNH